MGRDDSYTSFLMHFDGIAAAFTEETGKTMSYGGNATQSVAQSKFGGKSLYLDGAGDYVTSGNVSWADMVFGTDNFTIDGWVYFISGPETVATYHTILTYHQSSTAFWALRLYNNSGVIQWSFLVNSTTPIIEVYSNVSGSLTGQWIHIALTREGNDFKFYQNGVQVGTTVTDSSSIPSLSGYVRIGSLDASTPFLNGYVDELRVSKNIARWTAGFTPPSLPYGPAPIDDSYTKLLLHFDSYDNSPDFCDQNAHLVIPYSSALQDTAQFKFGTSSLLGSSTSVDCGISDDWIIGTQDFTADWWMRSTTLPTTGNYQRLWTHNLSNGANWTGVQLRNASGTYYLEYIHYVASALVTVSDIVTISVDTWYHCAIVKSGNDFTLYLNGVPGTTVNSAQSISGQSSSARLMISGQINQYAWTGHIDEFRWSVGTARWTANFSSALPSGPYPSTLNLVESFTPDGLLNSTSSDIAVDFPALTSQMFLAVDSGINIDLYLPVPTASSSGIGEDFLQIDGDIDLTLEGEFYGAGALDFDLAYPSADINMLPGNIIDISGMLSQIVPSLQTSSEIISDIDVDIPHLAIALAGSVEIIGRIAGSLPFPTLASGIAYVNHGSLDLEIPSMFFDSVLLHNGIIVIDADIPVLLMSLNGTLETATVSFKTIVMNTTNRGVSEYPDFTPRHITSFSGKTIAASAASIVSLGTSLDNGYFIPMTFSTGSLQSNAQHVLFPRDIWIVLRSGKRVMLTVRVDEGSDGTEYTYMSDVFVPELRKTRVKIGRGFRDGHYGLTVQNIDGEYLAIDRIEIHSDTSSSRNT
jgi:hypothetical protein